MGSDRQHAPRSSRAVRRDQRPRERPHHQPYADVVDRRLRRSLLRLLFADSASVLGLAYLLPVALLVTATLPITLYRVLHHRRVTTETILGALCTFVLLGLLFAFVYLAISELRSAPFFTQPGPQQQSEYLYFSFVVLTTLGFGDLSPSVGLPQALVAIEALVGSVFLVTLVARLVTLWVRQDEYGNL